jgi:hypothetical protein
MYKSFKEVYELAGKEDGFCVMSNDSPSINHGWVTDEWVDVNSSEINTGWNLTFGSRGVTDLPTGKLAVFYRTAIETAAGAYMIPWVYSDDNTKGKTETGKVYSAEAFANGAFIKSADNTFGTNKSYRWFNKLFMLRKRILETGIWTMI